MEGEKERSQPTKTIFAKASLAAGADRRRGRGRRNEDYGNALSAREGSGAQRRPVRPGAAAAAGGPV